MQFYELIGHEVALLIPRIHQTELQPVIVHGVESGGLWIESQEVMQHLLNMVNVQMAPKTLVFFLPYHQIAFGMSSIGKVSLSEKAFGV
jgi:hypothetical protein